MSLSFFLQLPSSLCTGCKNTEQRDLVQESGDLGCRSAPASNELGNHLSFFGHILFQREKRQRLTSTLTTSQGYREGWMKNFFEK